MPASSPDAEKQEAEQRESIARMLGDREESRSCAGREKRRDAFLGARPPDASGRRDRDMALFLGPAPECANDGCDLLPGSRRTLSPQVDDVSEVVDGP